MVSSSQSEPARIEVGEKARGPNETKGRPGAKTAGERRTEGLQEEGKGGTGAAEIS